MGDRSPKCFVPECYNTVGVLFPKSLDGKRKWLKALGLESLVPGPKSFVCLDHFGSHGQPDVRAKKVCAVSDRDIRQTSSSTGYPDVGKKKVGDVSDTEHRDIGQTSSLTVYSKYEKVCRLCMVQSSKVADNVFNKLDEKYTIVQAITICLHPLQVLPNDNLSKYVCSDCIKLLKGYLQFYQKCIAVDAKQRGLHLSEQNNENCPNSEPSEEYLHEERLSDYEEDKENYEDFGQDHINGLITKHKPTDSDITEKIFIDEEHPAFSKKRQRDRSEEDLLKEDFVQDRTNCQTMKPNPAGSDITYKSIADKDPTAFIKKRRDNGEAGLLEILEGNDDTLLAKANKSKIEELNVSAKSADVSTSLSESNAEHHIVTNNDEAVHLQDLNNYEEVYVEDIIIEMVDDEIPETPQYASPVTKLVDTSKLPITIKRVTGTPPVSVNSKRKLNNSNNLNVRSKMAMLQKDEEIFILPKGISVEVKDSVHSHLGWFKSKLLRYAFNSEYLLADGYLYEFGLMKDNVRRLRCIVKKCPGTAHQTRVRHNEFLEDIEVVTSHNHQAPDDLEKKRQMFYHILYSKMRRDKSFNFKVLYEQFCKVDPCLLRILPLRNVIREICKQGPTPSPPWLSSFDEFYELIENEEFHKIHFTDNHAQFYQDRFETDDGAKAVVFGNQDIIEEYSYSKLMYVDASFVIESDEFPFQLVTVLVWIDESYYPILYAFVNMRSQELYKKIFSFLYNNLAPSLRPQEIITDYESNLYYALGETYVESSIGGSMFYFTQSIYKKICSLNLARELELNANFRSIYNMLLMLPLLPVNTILDGLNNIEDQAKELELEPLTNELFVYIHNEWICKVTPDLFCVHRLENRINENIVAPFKKLRDLMILSKHKMVKNPLVSSVIVTVEKLLELEKFLRDTYSTSSRRSFTKDLSSTQKKMILKAWNYIENYPVINLNRFFLKVLGYIKCMENQLWIWGFYRYTGNFEASLIDASDFSIVNEDTEECQEQLDHGPMEEMTESQNIDPEQREVSKVIEEFYVEEDGAIRKVEARGTAKDAYRLAAEVIADQEMIEGHNEEPAVVMQAVIDENGSFVLQEASNATPQTSRRLNYVYK